MADFKMLSFQSYGYPGNSFYQVVGPITEDDVRSLNATTHKCIVVLKNTKDRNPNIIRKITNPNIRISVCGGLDYLHKQKFQDIDYIDRTIYSPNTLASVIEVFEKIEKQIRYSWTPLQKSMFVYKTLCEHLHYKYDNEHSHENGRDVVRSLEGLLYGKLVCSGFALVYKEAMDRLGIPCLYQNKQGHHSWNIIQIDGKNYGVELTWDCANKKADNMCRFGYFGLTKDFYQDKHHDISDEAEEKMVSLSTFDPKKLAEDYQAIAYKKNIEKRAMSPLQDSGGLLHYAPMGVSNGNHMYMIYDGKNSFMIYTNKEKDELTTPYVLECLRNGGYHPTLTNREKMFEEYQRDNKTQFFIAPSKHKLSDIDEYYYFDVQMSSNGPVVRRGILLSEMNLAYTHDTATKKVIANGLLGEERLRKKIMNYHGYVGYVQNNNVYYNKQFEEENLHVREHI